MDPQQAPLTRADLDQAVAAIVAVVRSEIAGLATRAELADVDTGLRTELAGLESRLLSRIEAAEHGTATNLTDLRNELVERLERLERRTERMDINVNAILAQMAGVSKSLTVGEQFDSAMPARSPGLNARSMSSLGGSTVSRRPAEYSESFCPIWCRLHRNRP